MTKTTLHISAILLSLFLATCCSQKESVLSLSPQELSEVPIECIAEISSPTKGMDPIGIDDIKNFGMYAVWNMGSTPTNLWFITDQLVTKQGTPGNYTWEISPQAYWPLKGNLSFFLFTPYKDASHPEIQFVPSTSGMPGVTFTPGQDPATHYDFCVAAPLFDRTSDQGPLTVVFDHALTRVHLYANYDGIVPDGVKVIIDKVLFENIYGTKTIYFKSGGDKYEWQDETGLIPDTSYALDRKSGFIANSAIPLRNVANDNHIALYQSSGRLYLLPQALSPDALIRVEYGFYLGDDIQTATKLAAFEKEVSFPSGTVWPMGKTVNLKLTLGVGVSSTVELNATVTEWEDSYNKHNQGNPVEYE